MNVLSKGESWVRQSMVKNILGNSRKSVRASVPMAMTLARNRRLMLVLQIQRKTSFSEYL